MAIDSFIRTHATFTTRELLGACGEGQTNRNLLSRAVASGRVERVARGVYASRCGRFEGVEPDRFDVAAKLLGADAAFAWQSALELYGVAHNVTPRLVEAVSPTLPRRSRSWRGVRMELWPAPAGTRTRWVRPGRTVTTPEQTLVDCVQWPARACGVENCVLSLVGLPVHARECLRIAAARGVGTLARVGLVLDLMGRWGEAPDAFAEALAAARRGQRSLGPRRLGMAFDARWRTYVPRDIYEWVEG